MGRLLLLMRDNPKDVFNTLGSDNKNVEFSKQYFEMYFVKLWAKFHIFGSQV